MVQGIYRQFEGIAMKILLVEQPDGGSSIGDHAQTLAIKKWLKKNYKGIEVLDFTLRDTTEAILSALNPEDILMFHSGGNLGDYYGQDEENRQHLILNAKRNKIIILPKTIRFVNQEAIETAEKVYNSHRDLTICCRDLKSYSFAQKHFCKARLVPCPDFALTLKPKLKHNKRERILGLFRTDPESLGSQKYMSYVDEEKDFVYRPFMVSNKVRKFTLQSFLKNLQKYKAVITDRMHGVYFSLITGTPCVAVSQNLGKTKSMMDWIKNVDYVKYVESAEEIPAALEQVCNSSKDLSFLDEWEKWFNDELKKRFYTNEPIDPKHLFSLIKNRRTIRHWYKKHPVGDETLQKILEAGAYAPCGANDQRVRLRLIKDEQTVKSFCRLKDDWAHNSFPYCIILLTFDLKPKGNCNNGKIEPMWERLMWQDSAAATMNMTLMAEAYGVNSCWITLTQTELEQGVRKLMNISTRYVVCNALFLGYSPVAEKTKNFPRLRWYGRKVQRNLKRAITA